MLNEGTAPSKEKMRRTQEESERFPKLMKINITKSLSWCFPDEVTADICFATGCCPSVYFFVQIDKTRCLILSLWSELLPHRVTYSWLQHVDVLFSNNTNTYIAKGPLSSSTTWPFKANVVSVNVIIKYHCRLMESKYLHLWQFWLSAVYRMTTFFPSNCQSFSI